MQEKTAAGRFRRRVAWRKLEMAEVWIRLLGACTVGTEAGEEDVASKSRKGASLMVYLILQQDRPVSAQRLIRELWAGKRNGNPENALKTMISRLRALLNGCAPGLGGCIASERGGYAWRSRPGVRVDALEMLALLDAARKTASAGLRRESYRRAIDLYTGDLYQPGDVYSAEILTSWLHREYLNAVYAYIELLKPTEEYNEINRVCTLAARIDDLDEHVRIERMRAMVCLDRMADAAEEYRQITRLSRRYLDADPGQEIKRTYRQLSKESGRLNFNLDRIRNELTEKEGERSGPFFCDYAAFKEIYNLQMRNLERFGSNLFLGVIMVGEGEEELNAVKRESAMAALTEILRGSLRRGDIVTRFSPVIVALLLPTQNYATGSMIMERIEQLFYGEYPDRSTRLYYRITLLGGITSQA